jgi:hypothetical protein
LRNHVLALGCQGADAGADLIALDLISRSQPKFRKNNWSNLLGWLLVLLFVVIGVPVFTWAYRRHLDVLTGPWIAGEKRWRD